MACLLGPPRRRSHSCHTASLVDLANCISAGVILPSSCPLHPVCGREGTGPSGGLAAAPSPVSVKCRCFSKCSLIEAKRGLWFFCFLFLMLYFLGVSGGVPRNYVYVFSGFVFCFCLFGFSTFVFCVCCFPWHSLFVTRHISAP